MEWILETGRLGLRRLAPGDRAELCDILQDAGAMYAYEHAFSEREVDDWLSRQLERYERDGYGLWAVIRREDGAFVGQAGLTAQDWDGRQVPEIGYLLKRRYWHMGYAAEAAAGCAAYAFDVLGLEVVYSIIRENNAPSKAVAERNGLRVVGHLRKHYYNMDMPHDVYALTREAYRAQARAHREGED